MIPWSKALTLLAVAGACTPDTLATLPDPTIPETTWDPIGDDTGQALSSAVDLGHPVGPVPEEMWEDPGPLRFSDATVAAGLGEAFGGGNTHGVGVGLVDLDDDGWLDLVLVNGVSQVNRSWTPSTLYWNNGDGTFTEAPRASFANVLNGIDGHSVAAGDVDNDGDVDLYVGAQPTNRLFLNQGDRTFVNVTGASNAGARPSDPTLVRDGRGKIVAMGDIDGDGWLDLVSVSSTYDAPSAALLMNQGDGTFVEQTKSSGIAAHPTGHPCALMLTDYDNDSDPDMWIWNDRGGHVLLRNDGGVFTNLGNDADGIPRTNAMGIGAADIDGDGDLDYYTANIGPHPLLLNQGDGTFVDFTQAARTTGDFGWGLAFEDFNLDGLPDLYVTQEDDRPILVYPNVTKPGQTPQFVPLAFPRPLPVLNLVRAHSVSAAFGDVDNDGRIDAVWATTDGSRIVFHRNTTRVGSHRYLEVQLRSDPAFGSNGGVGARVAVMSNGVLQMREIYSGTSRNSVSSLSARFGLGNHDGAEWMVVLWPDGHRQLLTNVPPGVVVVDPYE
ncbi:MAG: CRTAC1 family protein [Myxococcales bacterium]|nr:CRTAC1 family protein [Myxococcales bacterium]